MSPRCYQTSYSILCTPRVSGDEPKRQAEPAETGTLSLREWG